MRFGVYVVAGLMVLGALAAFPSASAQVPQATLTFKIEWEMEHEHVLPENGRGDMNYKVRMQGSNFVCASQTKTKWIGQIEMDPIAKWAGASPQPRSFAIEVENLAPGATPLDKTWNGVLNIAWNTEDRPKTGAVQNYILFVKDPKIDTNSGGSCNPYPTPQTPKSNPMVVKMADFVEVNTTASCDATIDPDKCLSGGSATLTEPAEEAPIFDTTVLLASMVALAVVMRRRKA